MKHMGNKKILLIAFKFPPYAGVGGYRWSKLSKYLAGMGHEIHVVTVGWKATGPNTLLDDVRHPNIRIHRIRSGCPHNLRTAAFRNPYLSYLVQRMFGLMDRFFYFDDEAQQWGRYLLPFCEQLIAAERIGVVIATGHPFQANRWAAVLKTRCPGIKLIQDFRDPWIDPFKTLYSEKKTERIRCWMQFAIEKADHCVFVTEGLARQMVPGLQSKCLVLSNGHDFPVCQERLGVTDNWIHIGNITGGRDQMARCFLQVCRAHPELIGKGRVVFYGHLPLRLKREFSPLWKIGMVEDRGIQPQNVVFEELKRSCVALQLNSELYPYLVSTKIYEHAAAGVPTLSINGGGEIDTLIDLNGLGISVRPNFDQVKKAMSEITDPGRRFDMRDFAQACHYSRIAARYSEIINR
jgi:glycosyltransferase involved in cell wall biosynthesis